MSEQFTKGGWSFDRAISRIVDAKGETICATGDSWNSYRNSDANAALIACAPEMYGMLASIKLLAEYGYSNSETGFELISMMGELNALLAKARGES